MTDILNSTQFPPVGPLLRGRNNPTVKYPLKWAHEYFAGTLPTASFPIDTTGGITDFGLMGNDLYGNCGACGEVHLEMTTAVMAGVLGPPPNSPLAVTRYNDYDGNQPPPGPGVDLASYAKWLFEQGLIKGWAPVDLSNRDQAFALMQAAGGLYIGVNLTDNNESQFNNGQPFDPQGQQPNPQDGHCVDLSKAATATSGLEVITWGRSWPVTAEWLEVCFWQNPNAEAFILLTTEEQLAKFDPQLVADCHALGGTVASPDQPPATPPPLPNLPAPLPAFYEDWWNALQQRERELEEWVRDTTSNPLSREGGRA